jgi:hypothetical protein
MAYSNINDQNFKAITNFNISLGLSEKERDNIALEYKRKNLITKRFAGSGADFPKRIPKYNEDKVVDISNRYFTPDLDDIKLEAELQRDFINTRNKDLMERKLALEEQKKIKEIKELNDAGIVLPEGINYFSEEGRAYIRSEASKHPKGFNEYIKDRIKAKEEKKIIDMEEKMAENIAKAITPLLNLTDPTEINRELGRVVNREVEEVDISDQQKGMLLYKLSDLARKEFNRRRRALGGITAQRAEFERQTQRLREVEEGRISSLNKLPFEFKKRRFPSFAEKVDTDNFTKVEITTPEGFKNVVNMLGWINTSPNRNIIKIIRKNNKLRFLEVDLDLNVEREYTKKEVLEFVS